MASNIQHLKSNILILNWRDPKNPKAGGAEIVTFEHAKAWVKKGHKVVWFTSFFKGAKIAEVLSGVTIVRKGNMCTVFLHAFFFYLFSGTRFDTVIDEIHGIPFFTPLYVRKPKKIAFIHEVAGEIWDYMYTFPINVVGKFLESFYFLLYKHILFLTVSHSTRNDLEKIGISGKNIYVILNGLTVKKKTIEAKEKDPTFIFVSRLVKMKGIENVLEAFAIIYRKNSKAKLWIVGDGNPKYIQHLKSKIHNLEKLSNIQNLTSSITFFGRVTEVKKLKLMNRAHLLLHASVKEGWGLVVVEAASQWTPSVVYNVSGLRDSVKNNTTGIVLSANSPYEMARQALLLIADTKRYNKFQKNGISWVKSLSWDKATAQSLKLLLSSRA